MTSTSTFELQPTSFLLIGENRDQMKMYVENFDSLKVWMSGILKNICDANPSALAQYIIALLKKDRSEQDLKTLCIEQLDVFLLDATHGFVDKLFVALNDKSYLLPLEKSHSAPSNGQSFKHPHKKFKTEEMKSHGEKSHQRISNQYDQSCFSNWNHRHGATSHTIYRPPPVSWNSEKDSKRGCLTEPPAVAPAAPGNPHGVAMNALQSKVDDYECELKSLKKELKASKDYVKELEAEVATLKRKLEDQKMCPASD